MPRAAIAFVLSVMSLATFTGCATGIFSFHRHPSRADAIARCNKEVPPDAVPYGDAMADCMERYGWVYREPARVPEES